jgi:hypothetical protein
VQVSADSLRGNLQLGFLTPAASEQLAEELRIIRGMWLSAGSDKGYFHEVLEDRWIHLSSDYANAEAASRFDFQASDSHGARAR